jgi:retron-type reverse transcriptase
VEIPKANGGTRKLGVPTVLDRFVQQAALQVLVSRVTVFPEDGIGFGHGMVGGGVKNPVGRVMRSAVLSVA